MPGLGICTICTLVSAGFKWAIKPQQWLVGSPLTQCHLCVRKGWAAMAHPMSRAFSKKTWGHQGVTPLAGSKGLNFMALLAWCKSHLFLKGDLEKAEIIFFSEMTGKERRSLQLAELKWVNLFPSECLFLMMLEILFCCKTKVLSTARTLARITI